MSAERRIQKLEEEVRWLRRQLAHVPVRVTPGGGGGGGTFRILQYENFPAPPDEPTLISCKGTLWYSEGNIWAPACHFTTATGEVGT